MNHCNRIKFTAACTIAFSILFIVGCGVKGKPLPPLQPPPIGGDPDKENKYQKKK